MGTTTRLASLSRLAKLDPALSLLVAAILIVGLLSWTGLRSGRAAAARKAELTRLKAEVSGLEALNSRYAPAVAAESLAWRRTWLELRALGVLEGGDERLATTQAVSRVAEEAGLRDVRVLIGPPDTTGLETRLSTEGIRRKPAPFSLALEGQGGMRSVIRFIGALPSSVAVTRVGLVRQNGPQRHRISLAVYELEFSNGSLPAIPSSQFPASDLRPPLERSAADRGDAGRPGG